MKKLSLLAALFLVTGTLFATLDTNYVSYEVMEQRGNTIFVRFRLNVPYLIQHVRDRIPEVRAMIGRERNPRRRAKLEENLAKYESDLRLLTAHPVRRICVFGDFNGWKTFASEIPNILEPTRANTNTWFTRSLVPFVIKPGEEMHLRYKFVLDLGVRYTARDGSEQEFIFLEDPRNTNMAPDGFDGFNSFFIFRGQ